MEKSLFRRERRSYTAKPGSARLDAKGWRGTGRSLPYDLSPRRSISRLHSDELLPEAPTANRLRSSASLPLSAGILQDDCTVDTLSSQGARVSKASSRTKLAHREKFDRRDSSRTLRERDRRRSTSASNQPTSYDDTSAGVLSKVLLTDESELTRESDYRTIYENPRAGPRRYHSSPAVPQTTLTRKGVDGSSGSAAPDNKDGDRDRDDDRMEIDEPPPAAPAGNEFNDENNDQYSSGSWKEWSAGSKWSGMPGMFKQPETNPITEDQLINEVRMIYAGLVMVEKKCVEVDKQQTESKAELSGSQWQAMISLHRTLLYEHHDFFLASQHPSASPVLKRLAEKYAMPARMWRYGIHSFLELLR